jgi:5-carboxymethyl-2-hydroxymuconate isomerase
LAESNYLPASLRPDHEFEGVVIELRDEQTYVVHECHETGIGRYSPVKSRVAKDLFDALRAYVRANGGTAIDGVPINFAG